MSKTVNQDLWRLTPRNSFRLDLTADRFAQLQELRRWSVKFEEICRINYGAQISSAAGAKEKFGRDRYLADSATGMIDPKKFYEGSNMRPWAMTWAGVYLDWGASKTFYGRRTTALFENQKLSIRHISGDQDSLVSWVDLDHYRTDHGVIHCLPYHLIQEEESYGVSEAQAQASRPYDLFYLLGIVMSRPLLGYYAELFATGSLQGAFSHVYPNTVKELPIPRLDTPLLDPADDWSERLGQAVGSERFDRSALRAGFATREESASALSAAARRRQELEMVRAQRAEDFADFMSSRVGDWQWAKGCSLEHPPEEADFLSSVGSQLESMQAVTAVRDQFREQTAAALAELAECALLQRGVDALAERIYGLAPKAQSPKAQ